MTDEEKQELIAALPFLFFAAEREPVVLPLFPGAPTNLSLMQIAQKVAATYAQDFTYGFMSQYARFLDGNLTTGRLLDAARRMLREAMRRAMLAGKIAVGAGAGLSSEDYSLLGEHLAEQDTFLSKFVGDIARGYPSSRVEWRVAQYANRIVGEVYKTAVGMRPDAVYRWILDPLAEHCQDCLNAAGGSGSGLPRSHYHGNELPHVPRDGTCMCKQGCRCSLIIVQ